MPLAPTSAQFSASRANGALSRGPATPDGKARSSQNGTRHGLTTRSFALLPGEDPAEHAALLAGYLARHSPADAAERLWVEQLAFAAWRLRRLEAVEAEVVAAAVAPVAGAPAGSPDRLPSLATLCRYRARMDRDRREALAELDRLRAARPRLPANAPARAPALRWIADRLEE